MSVIVKGMEIPKICDYCPMCKFYPEKVEVWCNATNRLCHKGHRSEIIPDWCPLVEIPEGARLIDKRIVKERMVPLDFSVQNWISEVDLDLVPTFFEEG